MSKKENSNKREALEQYKEKMKSFYKDNLDFLKLENEYYELQAKIAVNKLHALKAELEYLNIKTEIDKIDENESK